MMYGVIDHDIKHSQHHLKSDDSFNLRPVTVIVFIVKIAIQAVQFFVITCKTIYQTASSSLLTRKEKPVHGQVVLVTGAGKGIGRQLAVQFAMLGCTVVCVDNDSTSNDTTADEINKLVKNLPNQSRVAYAYTCDVKDQWHVLQLARKVDEEIGRVDILINITNTNPFKTIQPSTTMKFDGLKENIMSHYWTVLAFLPRMLVRKQGHVVSVTTASSLLEVYENKTYYSASQNAITELMDTFLEELGLHLKENNGITLTCVHPFFINTLTKVGDISELRLPALSLEFAAAQIIKGIRLNLKVFTIPRDLLVWIHMLR